MSVSYTPYNRTITIATRLALREEGWEWLELPYLGGTVGGDDTMTGIWVLSAGVVTPDNYLLY